MQHQNTYDYKNVNCTSCSLFATILMRRKLTKNHRIYKYTSVYPSIMYFSQVPGVVIYVTSGFSPEYEDGQYVRYLKGLILSCLHSVSIYQRNFIGLFLRYSPFPNRRTDSISRHLGIDAMQLQTEELTNMCSNKSFLMKLFSFTLLRETTTAFTCIVV